MNTPKRGMSFADQVTAMRNSITHITPYVSTNPTIPLPVQEALRRISQVAHEAQANAQSIVAANPLTSQTTQHFGAEAIRADLSAGGAYPLNVNGLAGVLAQPQLAGTSGPLSSLSRTLGSGDKGAYYDAVDVGHRFVWDGSVWNFAPGDAGSGWGAFAVTVPAPGTSYWASVPAGGGSVTITKADGTTASVAFGAYTTIGAGYLLWIRK